jgi:hypothetical protein
MSQAGVRLPSCSRAMRRCRRKKAATEQDACPIEAVHGGTVGLDTQRAGGTYGGTNAKPPVAHLADGFAVPESISQPRLDSCGLGSY